MKTQTSEYELIFGSNTIRNCKNAIELIGKGVNKQILRFRQGTDLKVLCDCDVKDQSGTTIAKLANSNVVYVSEEYEVDSNFEGIKVTNKSSEDVVLEFTHLGSRKFKLNGVFFVPGYKIVATDNYLDINANKIIGCTFESCSSAIGLS